MVLSHNHKFGTAVMTILAIANYIESVKLLFTNTRLHLLQNRYIAKQYIIIAMLRG